MHKLNSFKKRVLRLFFQKPGMRILFGDIGTFKTALMLYLSKFREEPTFYIATGKHIYYDIDTESLPKLRVIKSKSIFTDIETVLELIRTPEESFIVIHDTLTANMLISRAYFREKIVAKSMLLILNTYRELVDKKKGIVILIDYVNKLTGKPISWRLSKYYVDSVVKSEITPEKTLTLTLFDKRFEKLMEINISLEYLKREIFGISG